MTTPFWLHRHNWTRANGDGLANVTLGMKNLIGLYPGQVYGTVRPAVHSKAAKVEESGTASAIVDRVRANRMGLVVVDASVAMQGQGPSVHQGGQLVNMDLLVRNKKPISILQKNMAVPPRIQ